MSKVIHAFIEEVVIRKITKETSVNMVDEKCDIPAYETLIRHPCTRKQFLYNISDWNIAKDEVCTAERKSIRNNANDVDVLGLTVDDFILASRVNSGNLSQQYFVYLTRAWCTEVDHVTEVPIDIALKVLKVDLKTYPDNMMRIVLMKNRHNISDDGTYTLMPYISDRLFDYIRIFIQKSTQWKDFCKKHSTVIVPSDEVKRIKIYKRSESRQHAEAMDKCFYPPSWLKVIVPKIVLHKPPKIETPTSSIPLSHTTVQERKTIVQHAIDKLQHIISQYDSQKIESVVAEFEQSSPDFVKSITSLEAKEYNNSMVLAIYIALWKSHSQLVQSFPKRQRVVAQTLPEEIPIYLHVCKKLTTLIAQNGTEKMAERIASFENKPPKLLEPMTFSQITQNRSYSVIFKYLIISIWRSHIFIATAISQYEESLWEKEKISLEEFTL